MFVWTSGMHPAFALVFFVVGLMFVLHTFANAFRWTWGWDREERMPANRDAPPARGLDEAAWTCPQRKCLARNPGHARYCRMCGRFRSEA